MMTDNDIIKALECCPKDILCEQCPLNGKSNCMNKLYEYALDIVNRQQAEIERLNCVINKIKDLVKGLRIGFDNEMEYVFDETLEKINEITDECYEEVKE